MEEILIVDGYNCIHTSSPLKEMMRESLELSRLHLMDVLAEHRVLTGRRIILVFDAHHMDQSGTRERYKGIEVIYTAKEESADERIERLVKAWIHPSRYIYVVTSDYLEQRIVFGEGALRISSREFWLQMEQSQKRVQERLKEYKKPVNRLSEHLSVEIEKKLESLRNKKGP